MPVFYTLDEVNRILEASKEKWECYIFCALLWETGARITEVMLSSPKDIDKKRKMLRLRTLRRSEEVFREVPLSSNLIDNLLMFIEKRGISDHEKILRFTQRTALKYFKQACAKAGITPADACPKKLRHTKATFLLQEGYRIDVVTAALGNRDIRRMVQYYIDPFRTGFEKSC